MKILIIGSGGREHALAWKLKQSKKVDKVFCAPGNAGMARLGNCINIKPEDIKGLADFAHRNKIGLTVVGPEAPLVAGIVDEFQKRKLKVFGPNRAGAQLEGSKLFSKEFMRNHHIPTAPFRSFTVAAEAIGFCNSVEYPVVIKADGLAAGKGAFVVKSKVEARQIIEDVMMKKTLGSAGETIIVESFLRGQETSIIALTDGKVMVPLLPSQDHKQAYDNDEGPNTGGMGAFCPAHFLTEEQLEDIQEHILQPTVDGLAKDGITYRGVIYVGLMMTPTGPKVLEYNCRFGDPETQAILPLLKTDLRDLMLACVNGKLGSFKKLAWHSGAAVCVVMASGGYPGNYKKGIPINGLPKGQEAGGCLIFHSGTARRNRQFVTAGGRVLGIVARDRDLDAALDKVYKLIRQIKFDGAHYRTDIGRRVVETHEA